MLWRFNMLSLFSDARNVVTIYEIIYPLLGVNSRLWSLFMKTVGNVELLCDRGAGQVFSDKFQHDSDSKRVPEKVHQHEPKIRFLYTGLVYLDLHNT